MNIETVNLDNISDFERIDNILKSLIQNIEGTIPGSREFGLAGDSINKDPTEAMNTLYRELDEKVDRYLPEIIIENLELSDDDNGLTTLIISVGARS